MLPSDKVWTKDAIFELVDIIQEYDASFETSIKKNIWCKVAQKLCEKKIIVTWQQCNNKWKGLKRTYKEVKDNNTTSWRSKGNWVFLEAMNNILLKHFIEQRQEYISILLIQHCYLWIRCVTQNTNDTIRRIELEAKNAPSKNEVRTKHQPKFQYKWMDYYCWRFFERSNSNLNN